MAAVLYGIVPGIVKVGGWFELLFVNHLNCPFNTGLIIYIFVLVAVVLWALYETTRQKSRMLMSVSFLLSVGMLGIPFYGYGWTSGVIGVLVLLALYAALQWRKKLAYVVSARLMNTSLLCMLMIMIGYSSYAVIVIRSAANTPMDQNSPEDIFTLGTYLGREQYGDRPLFYGQAYTSQVKLRVDGNYCVPVSKKGAPVYQRKEKASADEPDRYEIQRHNVSYVYQQNMLFPRMYSEAHSKAYESWMGGVKGTTKTYEHCGDMVQVKTPTMLENLRFFLSYQVNFMYWRYFMWNFAGRQNDLQGNGEWEHGMSVGEIKNMPLSQGSLIVQVADRKAMTTKYTAAVVKKNITFSKDTYSAAYNKFSSFVSANLTAEDLVKNAAKSGYTVLDRKDVTTAEHNLAGVRSTREAMRWLFDAKKGEVSPLYECGDNDHLLIVVLDNINKVGYRSLDDAQVKEIVKAEVMKDKKAEMLIAKLNGVNSIAAAKGKGANITAVNQVTFAAPVFVSATGASEPALSGAVAATAKGKFSKAPVKGNAGVYVFQVTGKTQRPGKFDAAAEMQKLRQKDMQAAGNFMNELYIKANVVDNRYLFF